MKRLLAVFAHPDDEGAVSGTLAYYAHQGVHVALVCATKGEAGEISDPSLATPENLGEVREAELRCACKVIGVAELHLLGYCDSGMDGTPENEKSTAFIQADPDEVRFMLVKLIREIKPQVVITFEPFGWYGHPDHIATGRYASEAYFMASDPEAYPGAGPAWRPLRLFHSAFPRSSFQEILNYARENDLDVGNFEEIPFEDPDPIEEQLTHIRDVRPYFDIKLASERCHQTQFGEDDIFRQIPREVHERAMGNEYFIQVDPDPEDVPPSSSDLFTGIEG